MIGENIRKWGFWGLDLLKGGNIRKHYNSIKTIIEGEKVGDNQAQRYLENLLDHATKNTDYYKKYYNYKSLNDFPVITKEDIKKNYDGFLSNGYKKDELIKVQTSGSYGTPFNFYLTREKKQRQTAEIIYFSEWVRYYVGTKHAYLRARVDKSKAKLFMQNQYYIYTRIIDDKWLKSSREILKKEKIKILIGFPTAIATIAQYCHECGDTYTDFSIEGVITSSEPLLDSQRRIIESTFGCNCLSRYSTEELGVLAHECPTSRKHHINTASYKVEILDLNEDKEAKEGEIGRIIVTDLFSYAMPLIRYETGDLGIMGKSCKCGLKGPIIESLHGRTVESVYSTKGKRILPYFIEEVMLEFEEIIQYQFIQNTKENYTLKVVCSNDAYFDNEKAIKQIKYWMGNDAIINIEFVDEIEKLKSGKRPYVINDYKSNN